MAHHAPDAGGRTASGSAPVPLVLDFLAWLSQGPRPYAEVMEAWRTSCPRLTVWEDAVDAGLVARGPGTVHLTDAGRALLSRGPA